MSTVVEEPREQSAASLVTGIVGDLQRLVEQQFRLTQREIAEQLRQRAAAALAVAFGLQFMFIGAILLCLASVYLLHWSMSPPASDPAWLPLWGCHAVVAVVFFVIGGSLALVGRAWFRSVPPFHNPVTEILQEHRPWTTPPK